LAEYQKNSIRISVIVPVYNVEEYLKRCLDSLVNQTYSNLDILLVNDGSTDSSGQICDEYAEKDGRIRVLHKENGGVSSARNAGIDVATGDWISFIDSDDWIVEDYYEKIAVFFEDENTDMVSVRVQRYSEFESSKKELSEKFKVFENDTIMKILLGKKAFGSFFSTCTKVYKKRVLEGVRFELNNGYGEDILFNFLAFQNIKQAVVSEREGYFYYVREGSATQKPLNVLALDLLKNWQRISEVNTNNKWNGLIRLNYAYTHFILLAKAATGGIDESFENEFNVQKRQLLKVFRRNFLRLFFKRGIKLSKKIGCLVMFINFRLFSKIAKRFLKNA